MSMWEAATQVAKQLQDAGYLAVFAGGCVRDQAMGELLNKQFDPKDIDIATNATPAQIGAVFADQRQDTVGKTFGVMIINSNGFNIDVATFRQDGQYGDGRRPDSVTLITANDLASALRIDGARRDFTINAMYIDPISGKRFDLFGGLEDLRNGVLRAVGNPEARFLEDRLRMLRAIRFAAKYYFKLDGELRSALNTYASNLYPGEKTAWERIGDELVRALSSRNPAYCLRLLREVGLLEQVLPEMVPMFGPKGEQSPQWHPEGNAWEHTLLVVDEHAQAMEDQGRRTSVEMGLALALHDIAKPDTQKFEPDPTGLATFKITNQGHAELGAKMARSICNRLKRSGEFTDRVVTIVAEHMRMHELGRQGVRDNTLFNLLRRPEAMDLIDMQHADAMGRGLPLAKRLQGSHRQLFLAKMEEMKNRTEPSRRLDAKAIVDGHMLIQAGFKPGPVFGPALRTAFQAQIDGAFSDAESARAWVSANRSVLESGAEPVELVTEEHPQSDCSGCSHCC